MSSHEEVLLVPEVNSGSAGWCLIRVNPSETGCPVVRSHSPIIAETWSGGGPPSLVHGYAVTTSQVTAVTVEGGSSIPTRTETALPDGLRAVAVEIRGKLAEDARLPGFAPLNGGGARIDQSTETRPKPGEYGRPLRSEVPTREVKNLAQPTSGVCRISAEKLAGLTVDGGSVISHVRSYSGLIGQGFISCASTSYSLDGWPLLAGMLLDASDPGATPPPLPAMKPLPGHPGIFQAPGSETWSPRRIIATRVHGAWLVVSRAKLQQRLALLEHLRATVHE